MSRLGKRPIPLAAGVSIRVNQPERSLEVKGPKGTLQWNYPKGIVLVQENAQNLRVQMEAGPDGSESLSALWGMARSRMAWMVQGVAEGFSRQLEIQGVGYRAKVEGSQLILNIGASHPVSYAIPKGITITMDPKQTLVTIVGPSKELVGLAASQIRALKPPEPYKGKGIRYLNEIVQRKAGKTATAGGAGKATK